jgi:pyruvate dehydrogenase E1 component alpha subunit
LAEHLIAEGLATQAELTALDVEIQDLVDDSVEFAENSPEPDPSELRRYIFAED